MGNRPWPRAAHGWRRPKWRGLGKTHSPAPIPEPAEPKPPSLQTSPAQLAANRISLRLYRSSCLPTPSGVTIPAKEIGHIIACLGADGLGSRDITQADIARHDRRYDRVHCKLLTSQAQTSHWNDNLKLDPRSCKEKLNVAIFAIVFSYLKHTENPDSKVSLTCAFLPHDCHLKTFQHAVYSSRQDRITGDPICTQILAQ